MEKKVAMVFSMSGYVQNKEVQKDRGKATVEEIDENKTRVRIDNPDYHFTVPNHQRKDYRRILTNRINKMLRE